MNAALASNSPWLHSSIMPTLSDWYTPEGSAWCMNAAQASYSPGLYSCIMTTNAGFPPNFTDRNSMTFPEFPWQIITIFHDKIYHTVAMKQWVVFNLTMQIYTDKSLKANVNSNGFIITFVPHIFHDFPWLVATFHKFPWFSLTFYNKFMFHGIPWLSMTRGNPAMGIMHWRPMQPLKG